MSAPTTTRTALALATSAHAAATLGRRQRRRKVVRVGLVLLAVMAILGAVAVTVGDYPLSVAGSWQAARGMNPDPLANYFVQHQRLPRIAAAIIVGAALGVSGGIFQTLTRNPLGSPDVIGFTNGAATGALIQIVVFSAAPAQVGAGAMIGGMVSAAVVYGLSYRGGSSSLRLVLVGIGVAASLQAANSILIVRSSLSAAQNAVQWLAGSLNQASWSTVLLIGGPTVIVIGLAFSLQRTLTTLSLGDDLAGGLGVGVERSRLTLVAVGVALVATATAIAGPVAFVALAAPQLGLRLLGRGVMSLPIAALMGAVVVQLSDLVAQRLFAPTQLPVGVVTGTLGGAYLIWLLHRQWKGR